MLSGVVVASSFGGSKFGRPNEEPAVIRDRRRKRRLIYLIHKSGDLNATGRNQMGKIPLPKKERGSIGT